MAGASIQMGAAQVEGLSEPKTWYDYVASAALTMASPAAKGALSFISPQTADFGESFHPFRFKVATDRSEAMLVFVMM